MTYRPRIGLVGFGWMGQAHSRSYRSIPAYFPEADLIPVLTAVADTVPERVRLARENFGYESGTASWRELVERDDIDIVDITAPNGMHQEIAEAAAAAGKHIFCEKPVGIEPHATAAIEAAARRAGVISGCGFNYRWAPMVQYTRRLIAEGRFGELTHYTRITIEQNGMAMMEMKIDKLEFDKVDPKVFDLPEEVKQLADTKKIPSTLPGGN